MMMATDLQSRSVYLVVIEVSSLIVLNLLSLMGNTLVCISIYRNTRLRTTTNLYITALAISDLLSAVFVMPLSIGVLVSGRWIFGEVGCSFHSFFAVFTAFVSPLTMGLTALNRYVRMCRPGREYHKFFSRKKTLALLASVWVFVACYNGLPVIAGVQKSIFVPGYATCSVGHLSETGSLIHYGIVIPLFIITPLTITVFSYVKVAKKIQQHKMETSSLRQTSTIVSAREIRISKSIFFVVFAFMICWIPFWIIVLVMRLRLVPKMPRNVLLLSSFLLYISNTINPFLYAGMNPSFRREFRKIVCKERRNVGEPINKIPPQPDTNDVIQEDKGHF
ncbi:beta-1 adrenergic receptor-like [Montipora capricornis]|uniref:beta-1 adrenergic receptor-like n=1 Tax=Montipora capricornis TaxID=246305 RepID=UPI0035F1771D